MRLPITKKHADSNDPQGTPERALSSIHEALNRIFDENWGRGLGYMGGNVLDRPYLGWMPKVDISETEGDIRIRMNMPGVDPKDITVEVDEDSLVVAGRTEVEEIEDTENWYRVERETGQFRRAFELPAGCDSDGITARARHGTLYIEIPKKPEAQKKRVHIYDEDKIGSR